ncbi:hypothetical protein Tco_1021648, partial [Tanacetum coccineum]
MAKYSQKWHNRTSKTRSTKTYDGLAAIQAQLNNLGREIKKVNENIYVAEVECELCKGPHNTKDCPLKEEGKPLKKRIILNLVCLSNKEGNIEQQLRDSTKGIMQTLQIQASTVAAIKNQGASIKTLEIQIRKKSNVLQEKGSGSLPSSTEMNLREHVNSISTSVETDTPPIRRIRCTRYAVSAQQNSKLLFEPRQATIPFPSRLYDNCYDDDKGSYGLKYLDAYSIRNTLRNDALPRKEKDPGSFTLPCYIINVCFEKSLADLGASVSVMP